MDKEQSSRELIIILQEEREIIDFFSDAYNKKDRSINETNFETLEGWIFRTIQRIRGLKGLKNRFIGQTVKSNLQSIYLKSYEARKTNKGE